MAGFPEKVLIIDDDPAILEIEELALRGVGDIEINACGSYDQAMIAVNSYVPDLVLLDLVMPEKDGTDVVRDLREKETLANTAFIFVTGKSAVEMVDDYKKLGVIGVIHKPFKPSDLIMNVQRLWQQYRFAPDQ